jgi:hypothetical protein
MTLHGKIHNGMVVFEGGADLPEGTPVTVLVEQPQAAHPPAPEERMSEEEHRRIMEIMDRIAALPNENPGDTFSGRDHDKVLYPAEGRMP